MSRSRAEPPAPAIRRKPRRSAKPDAPPVEARPARSSARGRRHELWGVVVTAIGLFFGLALSSFHQGDWMGPVGSVIVGALLHLLGLGTYAIVVALGGTSVRLFSGRGFYLGWRGLAAGASLVVFCAALCHVALLGETVHGGFLPGGLVGELSGELLRGLFSTPGTVLVCVSSILLTLLLWTEFSVILTARRVAAGATHAGHATARGAEKVMDAWRRSKEIVERTDLPSEDGPVVFVRRERQEPVVPVPAVPVPPALPAESTEPEASLTEPTKPFKRRARGALSAPEPEPVTVTVDESTEAVAVEPPPIVDDVEPEIVAPRRSRRPRHAEGSIQRKTEGSYKLPSLDLLDVPPEEATVQDRAILQENARRLVQTLADFGVQGSVVEIRPGPVVTMYELQPAAGTKISKIAGLADDLAMALEALRVRIVAPIPGKNRVGFELPNAVRETVHLRELLADDAFARASAILPLALGKNIVGEPFYGDLARMPHLLVAGATGTGKSVGLNAMLASVLYRATPDETRLLLIDPKVVELQLYDGIPHLLLPVVVDMKKAAMALRWAVDEMERRYQLFADFAVRGLQSFNKLVDAIRRGDARLPEKHRVSVVARDPEGNEILVRPDDDELPTPRIPDRLPNIVIVVDEFADLMMVAAKDVETAIARLAQKARAAGIHLILATQRPSVDVITGLIKANFPSRVAFRVSSKVDSRTILDSNGAEQLLGNGDMLFMSPALSGLERVHGAYVSEEEVKRITDFWKSQGTPVYDERILRVQDEDGEERFEDEEQDELYDRAVALVTSTRRASTSWVQRKLGIGYNRAAKLMERMEREGVVGPSRGAKDREILVGTVAA